MTKSRIKPSSFGKMYRFLCPYSTQLDKGGFSRNFYSRTHVNFTRLNTIEAMYRRSGVHEKVEPRSTFTRGRSYIASVLFTRVDFTCGRR